MPPTHSPKAESKAASNFVRWWLVAGLSVVLFYVVGPTLPTLKCPVGGAFNSTLSCVDLDSARAQGSAACSAGESSIPAGISDGWGRELHVLCRASEADLVSAGPDGHFGTIDDIDEEYIRQYQFFQAEIERMGVALPPEWTR